MTKPIFQTLFSRIIIVALLCALSGTILAAEWNLIKPITGNRFNLKVDGKLRSYYKISNQDSAFLEVSGPTELKIYTRGKLLNKHKDVLYGLEIFMDDKERFYFGRGSSREKSVRNPSNSKERIGESKSIYIDVPEGKHTFRIALARESRSAVYTRYYIPRKEEEINYIAFLPRKFSEEVRLEIKEREYIYYQSSVASPIEIEVIGPTRIRGIARLEFDHTIRGEKPYRIQVKEKGETIATHPFTAKVSGTATYLNSTDKVPARGDNFYIDVPKGQHKYEIFTPDPDVSVLFRLYIPQKDLGNSPEKSESVQNSFLGLIPLNRDKGELDG